MLWEKAHYEEKAEFNKFLELRKQLYEWDENDNKVQQQVIINENDKEFYKKCIRILAKSFHPDNNGVSIEDMKKLNQLKNVLGV